MILILRCGRIKHMTRAEVRRAQPDDARAIADLHARSWRKAYDGLLPQPLIDDIVAGRGERAQRMRGRMSDPQESARYWVAIDREALVGFAVTSPSRDPDADSSTGEVQAIYLAPEAMGRGFGRLLLERAVVDLQKRGFEQATLWVLASNEEARGFYEHLGWMTDGATKDDERPQGVMHEVRYRRKL
jgi:ribosomal protein S18 acetylase RimI-like enzyme